jgi:tetratricopeptide (TPR) repeat protein
MSLGTASWRLALMATVLSGMPSTFAYSGTDLVKILGGGTSTGQMSCIADAANLSVASTEPKVSVAPQLQVFALSSCAERFFARPLVATIEACERFLSGDRGAVRERATAMFVLGHAYNRSPNSYVAGQDPSESKAMQIWQRATEIDPTYIEPYIAMGDTLGYSGLGERAQFAFDRAVKINPADWRVHTGRANAYYHSQKLPEALAAAEKSFAIAPKEPIVWMVLGRMLAATNQLGEAAKHFEAAAVVYDPNKIEPYAVFGEPPPLTSLAGVYKKLGKPALAAETMSKYIESIPPMGRLYMFYEIRAEYYELAGMFQKAADDLKEAAASAPPELSEGLVARSAILLARSGEKSGAGDQLRSVLARGNLKSILKVQVFLRNQGYDEVAINGKYDELTSRALDACLLDEKCAIGVVQAI